MAQKFVETPGGTEGGDPLREWLVENKNELKLTNLTKLDNIYDKLSTEMDYDDLIKFSESDLRPALIDDCGLKSSEVGRIIAVLKETPQTTIYKEANKANVVKIVLSNDEDQALQNINKQTNSIDNIISNISNELVQINENASNDKQIITDNFNSIITIVNQKKEQLLSRFDNKIHAKTQRLQQEKEQFVVYKNELNECHNNAQDLIENTSIDPIQRKESILSLTSEVLNKAVLDYNVKKSIINVTINTDQLENILATIGKIEEICAPKPPIIEITSTQQKSAQIKIHEYSAKISKSLLEYKIQHSQIPNSDDCKSVDEFQDNSKMNWVSQMFDSKTKDEIIINSLKPDTNYIVRVAAKNCVGWGEFSKSLPFKTPKPHMEFDLVYNKYRKYIRDNGTVVRRLIVERKNLDQIIYFTVCSSTKFEKNVHEFKIECIDPGDDSIGIMSNTKICGFKNTYHHKANANVYYWRNVSEYSGLSFSAISGLYCGNLTENKNENPTQSSNIPKWKANDIITVRVNCKQWNVKFFINNKQIGNKINIVPNIAYHPFIGTRSDDTEYKLHGTTSFKL